MNEKRMSILIVDDETSMVDTLADILQRKGYQIRAAYSGVEALRKVKEDPPSMLLADIKMAKLDGIALCREARKINPELPVILITGYSEDELMEEAKNAGATRVLGKPFDVPLLLKLLSELPKS